MSGRRIRDIYEMEGKTGAYNSIADVPGVTVGHCTVDDGNNHTGVTVILPVQDDVFQNPVCAASVVFNGFGKPAGLVQIDELGTLETPIALTNTLNVGTVSDALVEYTARQCEKNGTELRTVNPVVCECNDSVLNDIRHRAVRQEHVFSAIEHASADFEQGSVGAGRGMICYGLKGGIGSSSRVLRLGGQKYTIGVLVLANHGRTEDLRIADDFIGREIRSEITPAEADKGSIIMIVGCDIPLSHRQLKRVLKRTSVGLIRTGSMLGHGSGDIALGFTTAYRLPKEETSAVLEIPVLNERYIEKVFRACAQATEEAVLNALYAAETLTGYRETKYSLYDVLKKRSGS